FNSAQTWCANLDNGDGSTPVPPPVLAEVNPSDSRELNINVGSRANLRHMGDGGDESVTITDLKDGRVQVTMFDITQTYGSTTKPSTNVRFFPGEGNDKLYVQGPAGQGDSNLVYVVQAGNGNDVIQTGKANDQISGDAGDDTLVGRAGNDIINA